MENLRALVHGIPLTIYQKELAKSEFKKLEKELAEHEEEDKYHKGYLQGREDMAFEMADKKYTEEDIRKAIEVGVNAEAGDYPKGYSYKLGISLEDYFINSLNKQD